MSLYYATSYRGATGPPSDLSLANNGNVVIALKTPYDDGTTHVVLSPIEFMGRLAPLVPRPRVNLTRFHGVLSRGGLPPNSKLREYVVPQKPVEEQENSKSKAYSMTWAQRLKRVFAIDGAAFGSRNVKSAADPRNAARSYHCINRGS